MDVRITIFSFIPLFLRTANTSSTTIFQKTLFYSIIHFCETNFLQFQALHHINNTPSFSTNSFFSLKLLNNL